MKLTLLYESGRSREFIKEIRKLLHSKGPHAIYDKYDITQDQLTDILGGGTYGEHNISDKMLHRLRAPQNIYKLMQHLSIDQSIIQKIVKFYKKHKEQINAHKPSPSDEEAIKQLNNNERLAALVTGPIDQSLKEKYHVKLVKWLPEKYGTYYISKHQDIINAVEKAATRSTLELYLIQGLVFGYPWADVYNFVRNENEDLVDNICREDPIPPQKMPGSTFCTNPECSRRGSQVPGNYCSGCGTLLHALSYFDSTDNRETEIL